MEKGTSYTSWSPYSGSGYWGAAGSAEDRVEAGYDYVVPAGYVFTTPNAGDLKVRFPGDSLTCYHNYFYIRNYTVNSSLDFGAGLVFKNPVSLQVHLGAVTSSRHFHISPVSCPVAFENESGASGISSISSSGNANQGVRFTGKVSSASSLTLSIKEGATVSDFRNFFWAQFLGDNSDVRSAVTVGDKSALFLGTSGMPNAASISIGPGWPETQSGMLATVVPGNVVPVSSVAFGYNSHLQIAVDDDGNSAPLKVHGAFSADQASTTAFYIGITQLPKKTNMKIPLVILAAGSSGSFPPLSKIRFFGYTTGEGTCYTAMPDGDYSFSVETDDAAGETTLYLTLTQYVYCVKSQSGTMDWFDSDVWSDSAPPHAGARYFMNSKSPRIYNTLSSVFPGKSFIVNGGTLQMSCLPSVLEFQNEGMVLESGEWSMQYGDTSSGTYRMFSVSGNVNVVSSPSDFRFACHGNRRKGVNFTTGLSGAEGSGFSLMGPTVHDDPSGGNPRSAGLLVAFTGDNSGFLGTVRVGTNTVLAVGDGVFPGSVVVEGDVAMPVEAGAVRTWDSDDVAVVGGLSLAAAGAVETQVSADGTACGTIKVSGGLSYEPPVQVFLSRPIPVNHPVKLPVLGLAAGASGKLDEDDFVFSGYRERDGAKAHVYSFKVETDDKTGDRILYLFVRQKGFAVGFR